MNLEQFVIQSIAGTRDGNASFRIEAGEGEERMVVWMRTGKRGDGEGVDLFVVLQVETNPQGLRGTNSIGVEVMERVLDRDALQRLAARSVPGKRAEEIIGVLATEAESGNVLPGQGTKSATEGKPCVSQQLTLVYELRWETMEPAALEANIADVAASAQRKLRSISGLLVGRVVEVRVGDYEIEPPPSI